jgi:hypothetical protein
MATSTASRTASTPVGISDRLAGASFVLGGVTFFVGGAMHPGDSGTGSKISQLHEMLVDETWYPSHALLLVAAVSFAVAVLRIQRRGDLTGAMAAVTRVASVIAVFAAVGMAVHLFSALGADGIADGQQTLVSRVAALNEMLVAAPWALSIAALAVVGGLTRRLGNPVTLALGLVGGLAHALAAATIAYTDRFDGLFPVGSLIGVWALIVGLMTLVRREVDR